MFYIHCGASDSELFCVSVMSIEGSSWICTCSLCLHQFENKVMICVDKASFAESMIFLLLLTFYVNNWIVDLMNLIFLLNLIGKCHEYIRWSVCNKLLQFIQICLSCSCLLCIVSRGHPLCWYTRVSCYWTFTVSAKKSQYQLKRCLFESLFWIFIIIGIVHS